MDQKRQGLETLRAAFTDQPSGTRAPRLIVLVGIPGSGKTTFASRLQSAGWERVSQDDLGDRRACERATVRLLTAGRDVLIDRCNFDRAQRKHWLDYGKARGCVCGVIVFATSLGECLQRVRQRTDHPTLRGDDAESEQVVMRMMNSFVFPQRDEGFAFCRIVRSNDDFDRVARELTPPPLNSE